MCNFSLPQNGSLSKLMLEKDITDFRAAIAYVHNLPYGRNSDRSDFRLILKEHKGTCATKHAFLKQLAIEAEQDSVELYIGIYMMNEQNTNGVAKVLAKYYLKAIPEAHTYLKVNGNILDITRTTESEHSFERTLAIEKCILPQQIGEFKVRWHQDFIKQWLRSEQLPYSFETLWKIREECIQAIST